MTRYLTFQKSDVISDANSSYTQFEKQLQLKQTSTQLSINLSIGNQTWIRENDQFGNTFYLNSKTGYAYKSKPEKQPEFQLEAVKNLCASRGMSQITEPLIQLSANAKQNLFENVKTIFENDLDFVKWVDKDRNLSTGKPTTQLP